MLLTRASIYRFTQYNFIAYRHRKECGYNTTKVEAGNFESYNAKYVGRNFGYLYKEIFMSASINCVKSPATKEKPTAGGSTLLRNQ